MPSRTTTWIARGLGLLGLGLLAAGWWISGTGNAGADLFIPVLALAFSGVGALVASRHPRNAVGWIFAGVAVATGLGSLASSYADYWAGGNGGSSARQDRGLVRGPLLDSVHPRARDIPAAAVPGRPLALSALAASRMVRRAGIAGGFVTQGMVPGPLEDYPHLVNPYGVSSPSSKR